MKGFQRMTTYRQKANTKATTSLCRSVLQGKRYLEKGCVTATFFKKVFKIQQCWDWKQSQRYSRTAYPSAPFLQANRGCSRLYARTHRKVVSLKSNYCTGHWGVVEWPINTTRFPNCGQIVLYILGKFQFLPPLYADLRWKKGALELDLHLFKSTRWPHSF